MNIREVASEFSVFIFSQDADLGSRIKFQLNNLNYETHFFSDIDEMQSRIEINPPHIIVLDQSGLVISLSTVFEKADKVAANRNGPYHRQAASDSAAVDG